MSNELQIMRNKVVAASLKLATCLEGLKGIAEVLSHLVFEQKFGPVAPEY
jgi:hypothetical protein